MRRSSIRLKWRWKKPNNAYSIGRIHSLNCLLFFSIEVDHATFSLFSSQRTHKILDNSAEFSFHFERASKHFDGTAEWHYEERGRKVGRGKTEGKMVSGEIGDGKQEVEGGKWHGKWRRTSSLHGSMPYHNSLSLSIHLYSLPTCTLSLSLFLSSSSLIFPLLSLVVSQYTREPVE